MCQCAIEEWKCQGTLKECRNRVWQTTREIPTLPLILLCPFTLNSWLIAISHWGCEVAKRADKWLMNCKKREGDLARKANLLSVDVGGQGER